MKIRISLERQTLSLFDDTGRILCQWPVSTARNGAGECRDSGCTPRGAHLIRAKIGVGLPENTVFVGRRPTGEIFSPELDAANPGRDWILTRILWLSGCERVFRRLPAARGQAAARGARPGGQAQRRADLLRKSAARGGYGKGAER